MISHQIRQSTKIFSDDPATANAVAVTVRLGHVTTRYSQCPEIDTPPARKRPEKLLSAEVAQIAARRTRKRRILPFRLAAVLPFWKWR